MDFTILFVLMNHFLCVFSSLTTKRQIKRFGVQVNRVEEEKKNRFLRINIGLLYQVRLFQW